MVGKAVGHQPTGVEISKGKPWVGSFVIGEEVCYQPTGIGMPKGRPRVGSLVLGNAVGYQPAGIQMSKGSASRQFGAWEGCRSPTCRSRNFKG